MISILHLLWIVPLTGCISVAVMALCVVASRGDPDDVVELYEELKSIPAADVVEVRHGIPNPIEEVYEDTDGAHVYRHIVGYECPFCGSDRIAKYCADCGAKMDAKEAETT